MNHESLLREATAQLGLTAEDLCVERFMNYMELLLEWNGRFNLTAITNPHEVILKHFVDSLVVATQLQGQTDGRMIDVGTGAGFPGVPLKIMFPRISLTLLDSLNKRVDFLNNLVTKLSLSDVFCIHGRAEDLGRAAVYREQFDICVSRAVADLSILAEYCLPFVRIGGKFISMKGPDAKDELNRAKCAINRLGGHISEISGYKIPFTDISHSLIIISKISNTPSEYPRKPKRILKSPIS